MEGITSIASQKGIAYPVVRTVSVVCPASAKVSMLYAARMSEHELSITFRMLNAAFVNRTRR